MAQWVKNMPAMQKTQEMWVQALGQDDTLEEEMATHSSILALKIPWTEEPSGLQSKVLQSQTHECKHIKLSNLITPQLLTSLVGKIP